MRKAGQDLGQLRDAHAAAAAVAGERAKGTAPRVSGKLAGNVRWSGTTTAATLRVGGVAVPYANPIHWGWPRRGISPQPWLSEAAQDTEPTWAAIYERAVEKILANVKGV
jgi:hypothetical protein